MPLTDSDSAAPARLLDFDAIQPGDRAVITKTLTAEDVSGVRRPLRRLQPAPHGGRVRAEDAPPQARRPRHVGASYVSTLIGMQLPGAGALWMQQSFRWRNPVFIGDTIEVTLKVAHKSPGSQNSFHRDHSYEPERETGNGRRRHGVGARGPFRRRESAHSRARGVRQRRFARHRSGRGAGARARGSVGAS